MTEMKNFMITSDYQAGETNETLEFSQSELTSESSTEIVSDESVKSKQKFRSRHFPEPFWDIG